ncbi:hypothetical protein HMI55_001338 [Coelomomyces lativittatus]|nr:hypothetical protein HMI55_001338 [Coelomomyces lativittatus]
MLQPQPLPPSSNLQQGLPTKPCTDFPLIQMDNAPFMPASTPFTPNPPHPHPEACLEDRMDSQTTLVGSMEESWFFRFAKKIGSSASVAAGKVWAIATSNPETTRNEGNNPVLGDRLV